MQKTDYWRCRNYLDFIRSLPSCIGGPGGDAHHIKVNGQDLGVKPHDIWVIPLSREQHTEFHAIGVIHWEIENGSQLWHAKKTIDRAIAEGVLRFEPVARMK